MSLEKAAEKVVKKYPNDTDIWALINEIHRIDEQDERFRKIELRLAFLEKDMLKVERLVDALDTITEIVLQRCVEKNILGLKTDGDVK